jgi:hypothetical protein
MCEHAAAYVYDAKIFGKREGGREGASERAREREERETEREREERERERRLEETREKICVGGGTGSQSLRPLTRIVRP